jgi:hypothetical protein
MGTAYVLSNWELDKDVFTKRFVNVKLGPIFDAGKITGPATFGSREWLFDLGAQTKLRVMGAQVTASYAWDMRTLTGAYYLQIGGWPRQRSR